MLGKKKKKKKKKIKKANFLLSVADFLPNPPKQNNFIVKPHATNWICMITKYTAGVKTARAMYPMG